MSDRYTIPKLAIFSILSLMLVMSTHLAVAQESGEKKTSSYTVTDFKSDINENILFVEIVGDTTPAYTVSEKFNPFRVVLDIAGATFPESLSPTPYLPANPIAKLYIQDIADQSPAIKRFEFEVADTHDYKVDRVGNNIQLTVSPSANTSLDAQAILPAPVVAEAAEKPAGTASELATDTDDTLDQLIESSNVMLSGDSPAGPLTTPKPVSDSFSFSGYDTQRISVDFFKIDIHNVFRLFRQITGLNIIVDSAVSGTVTLALTDVPWDFALDIIMNLTNLEKEERFNTLVIYPKQKDFVWPEKVEDNLSFEADIEVVEQEALIISESANQPKEIIKAKELLRDAQKLVQSGDFDTAAPVYAEASNLWPNNSKIYERLSMLYLVNLGQNAKALYYAKKGLEQDKGNDNLALYAAISAANMQKKDEAAEYFTQAISGNPPMQEALFSFAAFNENNNQFKDAIKILETYESNYGETLDTMLAKARIYDKIGKSQMATDQYKMVLTSGYQIRPDLKKYINSRIASNGN